MKYKSNFLTEIELLVEKGALKSPKMIHILHLLSWGTVVSGYFCELQEITGNDEKQSLLCEINVIDLDLNCWYNHAHYLLQDFYRLAITKDTQFQPTYVNFLQSGQFLDLPVKSTFTGK